MTTFAVATTYLCVSAIRGTETYSVSNCLLIYFFFFSFIYLFALEHIFHETQERDILTKDGANFLSFYCIGPKHQLQQRLHVDEKHGTWLALLHLSLWPLHFKSVFSRDTILLHG